MLRYVVIQDWVSGSIELRRWGSRKSKAWGRRLWRFNRLHDKVLTEPLSLIEAHRMKRELMAKEKNGEDIRVR